MKTTYKTLLWLVKEGLFPVHSEGLKVNGSFPEAVDWGKVYQLAEAQSVIGLVAGGIDIVQETQGLKFPQEWTLQFIGSTLQIEQRNKAMNVFIADIVARMRIQGIYALLVKGQGVGQCYDKPLWRPSGDIDFLLSDDNYKKADKFFTPIASYRKFGGSYSKEVGFGVESWTVEIHGSLRTGLSYRVDKEVDNAQRNVFYGGSVKSWQNGKTQVFLPGVNEDVFFVFTHFIKHFYKEGMTLRQVCDWCRLLWSYRDVVNLELLQRRLRKAGLMKEWKAFASLAVEFLGMPAEAMPFYDGRNRVKGEKLVNFILDGYSGNKFKDTCRIASLFPWKTFCYSPSIFLNVNWLKIKEKLLG